MYEETGAFPQNVNVSVLIAATLPPLKKKKGAVEMLKTLSFKRLQALKDSILGCMTQR